MGEARRRNEVHLGCAGWSLPRETWAAFPAEGTHLVRYAQRLPATEINSSFYRPHRPATYARWADSVPPGFRFSVKLPKAITHQARLQGVDALLERFLGECSALGERLGCLLVQLAPSHAYEAVVAERFFARLRTLYAGPVALEPRHRSWVAAQALLIDQQVARVAADPSPVAGWDVPDGWPGLVYYRLHGSPRIYHSRYTHAWLAELARQLQAEQAKGREIWCIFDNTASGAATDNALELAALLDR